MTVYHVALVRLADHREVWEQHEYEGHAMSASDASWLVLELRDDPRNRRDGHYLIAKPMRGVR